MLLFVHQEASVPFQREEAKDSGWYFLSSFYLPKIGLEKYYSKYLAYLTNQPPNREQIAASAFEMNMSIVTDQKGLLGGTGLPFREGH